MGGFGSGRHSDKQQVDGCWRLDVAELRQPKRQPLLLLKEERFGGMVVYVWLKEDTAICRILSCDPNSQDLYQVIVLTRTSCHFGGYREWFHCPLCRERVKILYSKGRRFACRKCYDLTYLTRTVCVSDRKLIRASRIRQQLGLEAGITRFIPKPLGMHWKTFKRLQSKIYRLEFEYATERFAKFL